jgi:hypothetical protein
MLISYVERKITRIYPESMTTSLVRLHLAKLHLRREIDKTLLVKFIKKILDKTIK